MIHMYYNLFGDQEALRSVKTNVRLVSIYDLLIFILLTLSCVWFAVFGQKKLKSIIWYVAPFSPLV